MMELFFLKEKFGYVIQNTNLDGLAIYTKGKFIREAGSEIYYFLISAKRVV
jgi:hypothetical protein